MENSSYSYNYTTLIYYQDIITYRIGQIIAKFWFPVTGPLGLFGDILCLIVMLLPHNRKLTTAIYLAVTAVNDSFVIIFTYGWAWYHDYFTQKWGSLECKLWMHISISGTEAGAFILLLMTYDRYYVIRNPLKASLHSSLKRVKFGVSIIYVVTILVNGCAYFAFEAQGQACDANTKYAEKWYALAYWFLVFFTSKYVYKYFQSILQTHLF